MLNTDPVIIANFILAFIIFVLGIAEYWKSRYRPVLLIGTTFGLFALSHLITLLGYAAMFELFIVIIRIIAYLLTIYAVLLLATRKNAP